MQSKILKTNFKKIKKSLENIIGLYLGYYFETKFAEVDKVYVDRLENIAEGFA